MNRPFSRGLLSIVGTKASGKSTLAEEIYNSHLDVAQAVKIAAGRKKRDDDKAYEAQVFRRISKLRYALTDDVAFSYPHEDSIYAFDNRIFRLSELGIVPLILSHEGYLEFSNMLRHRSYKEPEKQPDVMNTLLHYSGNDLEERLISRGEDKVSIEKLVGLKQDVQRQNQAFWPFIDEFPVILNTDPRDYRYFEMNSKALRLIRRIKRQNTQDKTSKRALDAIYNGINSMKANEDHIDSLAGKLTGYSISEIRSTSNRFIPINYNSDDLLRLSEENFIRPSRLLEILPRKVLAISDPDYGILNIAVGIGKGYQMDNEYHRKAVHQAFELMLGEAQLLGATDYFENDSKQGLCHMYGVPMNFLGSWGFRDMPIGYKRHRDFPMDRLVISMVDEKNMDKKISAAAGAYMDTMYFLTDQGDMPIF